MSERMMEPIREEDVRKSENKTIGQTNTGTELKNHSMEMTCSVKWRGS